MLWPASVWLTLPAASALLGGRLKLKCVDCTAAEDCTGPETGDVGSADRAAEPGAGAGAVLTFFAAC